MRRVLLSLVLVTACAAESSAPQTPESPTQAFELEPDFERMSNALETLSSDELAGRLTGTASGDAAEAYLLEQLSETGLRVETQDVTFPLYEVTGPAALERVDDAGATQDVFTYIDDYREVDFGGSGDATGELVFVGYGLDLPEVNSFEGLTAESGHIAVVLLGVPGGLGLDERDDGRVDTKIENAVAHGAAGVVFVLTGDLRDHALSRGWETELSALYRYELFPEKLAPDVPAVFVQPAAVERLVGRTASSLISQPAVEATGRRARVAMHGVTHEQATCRNVFGILDGQDPDVGQEVILLGAHYDHLGVGADGRIFNGAGDNASGTGVVLETALAFGHADVAPSRTVVFAFWCAEEQGLFGSLEYTYYGTPLFPLADTKLMLQVDYLGETSNPMITNTNDNPYLEGFLGDAYNHPEIPLEEVNWYGNCASDDCSFLYFDVPAYRFLAEGEHHHQATDTFEHLNLDTIWRVTEICVDGVRRLGLW